MTQHLYQLRVVEEKVELDGRLTRLGLFIGSDKFHELPEAERERLTRQWQHMSGYSQVLGDRIAAFGT